ncbi:hypothetical protein Plim_2710 [Planctopirus limnophila DSM 3776]|uniref:Uncharacterized protein n=1 Tax=Planctopirus limnophila (strain ATCC 43296 / DSM 3776 / IFAM 1008 / Mu 290) TaxID=521674 RepID=D5SQS1_PLAL2|nr:hypothetical protein Plim_2710 [Planctopirus limnophila DSM 3776]
MLAQSREAWHLSRWKRNGNYGFRDDKVRWPTNDLIAKTSLSILSSI